MSRAYSQRVEHESTSPPQRARKLRAPNNDAVDPITILLVDDEEIVLRVTGLMLTELGYHVLSAAKAEDALELFHAQPNEIRLLLTDVVMPGTNGRKLVTLIHRERPDLKVLYMSGFVPPEPQQESPALEPLLSKPFSPDQLSQAVRDALRD